MREKVIVSRKWHQPEIRTFVSIDQVGSEISLDDFLQAMVEHMGNPTLLVTKNALQSKVQQASIAVLDEMRKATIHIV